MYKMDKCAKCGSTAIAQRVMVADRDNANELDLRLRMDARPSAMVLKRPARSVLHACVCSSCGYVELYADDPQALYDAFVAAQSDTPKIT